MKLRGENIFRFKYRDERRAVIAECDAGVTGIEGRVGVRKIKVGVVRHAFEQLAWPHAAQLVPSHMWQTVGWRKSRNILGKQRQPRIAGRFIAGCKHRLQSQANAKKGNSARNRVTQRLDKGTLI